MTMPARDIPLQDMSPFQTRSSIFNTTETACSNITHNTNNPNSLASLSHGSSSSSTSSSASSSSGNTIVDKSKSDWKDTKSGGKNKRKKLSIPKAEEFYTAFEEDSHSTVRHFPTNNSNQTGIYEFTGSIPQFFENGLFSQLKAENSSEVLGSIDGVVEDVYEENQKDDADDDEDSILQVKRKTSSSMINQGKRRIILMNFIVLILFLVFYQVLVFMIIFTCNNTSFLNLRKVCLPQISVKLTDKSPLAQNTLFTVKEALKVLSYLALDLNGDNNRLNELDAINDRIETFYYKDQIIDTFSVDSIYRLNFMGFCRENHQSVLNVNFCMKGFGLDLLSVFVRDAGAQLGRLTNTNMKIMGESFAIAYELAVSGFNDFSNKNKSKDNIHNGNTSYINYAILLQKFSKSLGFLVLSEFFINLVMLFSVIIITIASMLLLSSFTNISKFRNCLLIITTFFSFIGFGVNFIVASLTFEYYLKLSEISDNVGIAKVNLDYGFLVSIAAFCLQFFIVGLCVYLLNCCLKRMI